MKINPQSHPAYKRYLSFNKNYPAIKSEYKKFDNWYFENKAHSKHKDGVYVPADVLATNSTYVMDHFSNELMNMQQYAKEPSQMNHRELKAMSFINGFKMFQAWRMSLSVYKIDNEIFDEMLKSPIPLDTPSEIFSRLPDFCVYVEFPRLLDMREINPQLPQEIDIQIRGFWAYLNYPLSGINERELNFCADILPSDSYPDTLSTVSMIIADNLTVKESADLVFEQYQGMSTSEAKRMADADKLALYTYLPMLLWLCADEPDISNMSGEPMTTEQVRQPKYSQKKGGQFVPPSTPRIHNLGQRLGGDIRKFKDEIAESEETRKGIAKRPHIRKGHWHGYWHGSGQDKQFIPKWLSAMFVNASN